MITKFIEATNDKAGGGNWGKFMVARFDEAEWARRSSVDTRLMLQARGWSPEHVLVLDLQTGEGAMFAPHGFHRADLQKHAVWVCPLFEPFLGWLYKQDLTDLEKLPLTVQLPITTTQLYGHRRPGPSKALRKQRDNVS